ncbi:hypothetical protein Tco_1005583 [Tanacetum coccineum]|uniref:Uncharacterized protein n=1 Tax=Tanacetum coccineum TaxID=301880 RepID=A0ABQ5FF98_9ASTR
MLRSLGSENFFAGLDKRKLSLNKDTYPALSMRETGEGGAKRSKKKRSNLYLVMDCVASHPPKRLRADYGTTGGSATGGAIIVATSADVSKDKSAPHPSIFGSSSSSEKTDRTLSLLTGRSGSGFDAGRSYIVRKDGLDAVRSIISGGEEDNGDSCGVEKYFVRWQIDKEIEDLRSCQLLIEAKEERSAAEEQTPCSRFLGLDGQRELIRVRSLPARTITFLLEQECAVLLLPLKSQNPQSLGILVHELEISSADLREKLETRLAEIDADFTRCCMRFQESFHPPPQRRCGAKMVTNSWDEASCG